MTRNRPRQPEISRNKSLLLSILVVMLVLQSVAASLGRCAFASPIRSNRVARHMAFLQPNLRTKSSPDTTTKSSSRTIHYSSAEFDNFETNNSGYQRPVVQWYPGHIAKAERMLKETFKAVDVVVEVRDARAAKATSHPMVGPWCAGRPRLVVLTHADAIPTTSQKAWTQAYERFGAEHRDQAQVVDRQVQNEARQAARERLKYSTPQVSGTKKDKQAIQQVSASPVEDVLFINAKTGQGIHGLTRAIFKAGSHVQERRERRGLKERPLRVGVIGYPNVGKSALINKLLGRKRARTANTPGVTRSLQWIRIRTDDSKSKRKEFELLDSPGIIPATLVDQSDATLLAACNCIGNAAYDNQAVAAYLCEWLMSLYRLGYGNLAAPEWRTKCQERYKFDPLEDKVLADGTKATRTGEDMLFDVADATCQGDPEDASRKILQDFRAGRMGPICLQVAPSSAEDKGQRTILGENANDEWERRQKEFELAQEQRAEAARQKAAELGLELPPQLNQDDSGTSTSDTKEVGKGLFDGW